MHRTIPIAAAAAVAAALVPLATGSAQGPAPTPFTLTEGKVTEALGDTGRKGPSVGDTFVFTSPLTRDGKAGGRLSSTCSAQNLRREEFQCVATFVLPEGRIAAHALVARGRGTAVITGGTGAYAGAEGTIALAGGRRTVYTVRLQG